MKNEKKIEIAKKFNYWRFFFFPQKNSCMNLLQICEPRHLIKMHISGKILKLNLLWPFEVTFIFCVSSFFVSTEAAQPCQWKRGTCNSSWGRILCHALFVLATIASSCSLEPSVFLERHSVATMGGMLALLGAEPYHAQGQSCTVMGWSSQWVIRLQNTVLRSAWTDLSTAGCTTHIFVQILCM